jgi:hypothetical protein
MHKLLHFVLVFVLVILAAKVFVISLGIALWAGLVLAIIAAIVL